ncbi:MAG: PrsW family glutamic-type intramembrane protease [Parcubacteria group bacterium]|jgi:hypothetical protein
MGIFFGVPIVGVLIALGAVVAEQLLAVIAAVLFQKEIMLDVYNHLGFFIVAAAVIEEAFKYIAVSQILRKIFDLRGMKLIFSAIMAGLFFGLTEVFLVLVSNGKNITDIKNLGNDTLFSLLTVILVHILTIFMISVLVAVRREDKIFNAFKIIIPPTLVHLLYNFLVIQKGEYTIWLVSVTLAVVFLVDLFILFFSFRDIN